MDVLGAGQDGRDGGVVRGAPVHGVGAAQRRPSAGVVVVWRAGPLPTSRHRNLSVERTGYRPAPLTEVLSNAARASARVVPEPVPTATIEQSQTSELGDD